MLRGRDSSVSQELEIEPQVQNLNKKTLSVYLSCDLPAQDLRPQSSSANHTSENAH